MKVYIESYGCTANQADAAAMREAIAAAGGTIVDGPAEADAVIVNTCAVTHYTANAMLRAVARHQGRRVISAGSRRRVLVTEKGKTGTVVARDSSYNLVVLSDDLPLGTTVEAEIFGAGTTYMIGRISRQRLEAQSYTFG
jgi:tRNA A37 methylthiotransferase MiaB